MKRKNDLKRELESMGRGDPRTAGLTIRLSVKEKNDIKRMAQSLNLSVTDYIVSIHKKISDELK